MVKQFITHYGFSYGFGDLVVPDKDKQQILDDIKETYGVVSDLTDQYEKGTLKLTRGMKAEEALEAYIVNELGKARDKAGNAANNSLDDSNAGKNYGNNWCKRFITKRRSDGRCIGSTIKKRK